MPVSQQQHIKKNIHSIRFIYSPILLIVFLFLISTSSVFGKETSLNHLFSIPLSELLKMEVSSVSKDTQSIKTAPAAIYVISEEDIKRSGVNSIPEALRMVPGLNVAQLDASKWAISARGFNQIYSKYLLVLIDGRSVYSPLFSGVHWDAQDYVLDDIKRIEVIRGPGATLWGANAVNGVINIITKKSAETQGILIDVESSNNQKLLSARFGGKLPNNGHFRFYTKVRETSNSAPSANNAAHDEWNMFRTGFRSDWHTNPKELFTLQGDYYKGIESESLSYPLIVAPYRVNEVVNNQVSGLNILTRWTKTKSSTSEWIIQTYFDKITREELAIADKPFTETHNTFDFDLQHKRQITLNQKIIWGLNFRYIQEEISSSFRFGFTEDYRTVRQFGGFIQNEISLIPNKLSTTIGTKIEHFQYIGFEIQPNARLIWTPNTKNSIWASVARAVSNPARINDDAVITIRTSLNDQCGTNTLCVRKLLGNPNILSEKLNVGYEMGFRSELQKNLTFDAALFYNKYTDLLSTQLESQYTESTPVPHEVIPRRFTNGASGTTKGMELSSMWQATSQWRLFLGAAFLKMNIEASDNYDVNAESPEKSFHFRSYYNINEKISIDTMGYYVSDKSIPSESAIQKINAFWRIDTRLSWSPQKSTNIIFGARNLLNKNHQEFADIPFVLATNVKRSVYAKVTRTF